MFSSFTGLKRRNPYAVSDLPRSRYMRLVPKARSRFYRRSSMLRRLAAGPAGNTRRYTAGAVREVPLYAPMPTARNEMKYVDVAEATYAGTTTGSVTLMNSINAGSTIQNREGLRVVLCGAQIRGFGVAGTTGTVSRGTLVLVYDRQANGAAPAITDVYETVDSDSFQLVQNRTRFDILGRWTYTFVGNSTTPTTGREYVNIDLKESFSKPTTFSEGAVTVVTGALYLLVFGDTAAGTAAPNFTLQLRTMFGDN